MTGAKGSSIGGVLNTDPNERKVMKKKCADRINANSKYRRTQGGRKGVTLLRLATNTHHWQGEKRLKLYFQAFVRAEEKKGKEEKRDSSLETRNGKGENCMVAEGLRNSVRDLELGGSP